MDILYILIFLPILRILDKLWQPLEGRYFFLHTIVNFVFMVSTIQDMCNVYKNPLDMIILPWNYSYGYNFVISLHIYHIIIWFQSLKFVDWIHHITMIFIVAPLAFYRQKVIATSLICFFMIGLPGFIDYFLLTCVKNNCMNNLLEKKLYVLLTVWLRSPGMLVSCGMTLLSSFYHYTQNNILYNDFILILLNIGFCIWNAQYFMNHTLKAYYSKHYKNKFKKHY